jgi:lipopolysaccharide transport system ATP-binding protein
MNNSVIKVENLSKEYRFGVIGHGTLYKDLQSWWARMRGREDPNSKISLQKGPARTGERFWALKDISFDVKEGEVLGIIGRNGAGKSTLLKILSRVTTPTEGYVKIRGRVSSLLEVGTGFHQELTGRENVYLNGMIHGMTKAEINKKFDEIVDFSGVERFIDTPVKRYSSGMNVRLGFAVAAYLEPEVLIVDEVLAVGDAEFRQKCMGKMRDVSDGGRTVLFVSHRMSAIRELCQRGILLEGGKIVNYGPADEVVDKYLASSSSDQNVNEDILPRIHSHHNPDVEIYRIELLDTTGEIIDAVQSDQDFCLKLYFKFNKSMKCRMLIAFWNRNGLAIARIADPEPERWLDGKQGDVQSLTVKVKNVFVAGTYSISAGFRDKSQVLIDRIENVFFEISPSFAGDTHAHNEGVIQLPTEWYFKTK